MSSFLLPLFLHPKPLLFCLALLAIAVQAQVSPFDYGLREATTGTERFESLRRTHAAALEQGTTVNYDGIDTLFLEIPRGAQSIPLTWHSDFGNTLFIIKNCTHSMALFEKAPALSPVASDIDDSILCAAIDNGDFSHIPQLCEGSWLVEVTDSTRWVEQREGYKYGHYRQELIRIRNGHSLDRPAMPYSSTASKPRLQGRRTETDRPFFVGHIALQRDTASAANINLLDLQNLDSITLQGIVAVTTASRQVYDGLLKIYSCADIFIDTATLVVSGSSDYKGYDLLMNNCRNARIQHLYARNPWGAFGTNNMYNTLLEDCDANRFDIHCYGRDVTMRRCQITDSYNQFSSVYGTIRFDSCRFDNSLPVLIEDSYNAYNHFTLVMRNCWWRLTRDNSLLIRAGRHTDNLSARPELQEKCLPDIDIQGLELQADRGVRRLTLVHYRGKRSQLPVGGIRQISLRDVRLTGARRLPIRICDTPVSLSHPVQAELPNAACTRTTTQTYEKLK